MTNGDGASPVRGVGSGIAGIATILAAGLHGYVAYTHLDHSLGHGTFLGLIALGQLLVGILFLTRPSYWTAASATLVNAALITLWLVTRFMRAPFAGDHEAIDVYGILTKVFEFVALISLLVYARGHPTAATNPLGRTAPLAVVAVGLLLGYAAYGGGIALEPLLSDLVEEEDGHHHDDDETGGNGDVNPTNTSPSGS